MSSDHKTDTRSGGVEVVADQGDDGSFEIRLERQHDAAEETQPADAERTATWHAKPEAQSRRTGISKPLLLGIVAAVGILLLVVGIIFAQTPSNLGGSRPQTVEINEQPRFRGYVVAGQEPERASNLRLDAEETDSDVENEDQYVDDDVDDGPTRINLRSAASGTSDGERELTAVQEGKREIKARQKEAAELLKSEIREYRSQRDEEQQADEDREGFDDEYYDEFDEDLDDYDLDEFDEYDDYDLEGER